MTGLGSLIFPSQAGGNLIYVDGQPVGSRFVGQEFTDPRFMRGRPSQYHYNTYYVGEDGVSYYNDGSEYAGLSSGSANYANSNPALAERVEGDINNFLSGHPSLTVGGHPRRSADRLRLRPGPPHQPRLCGGPDPRAR